MLTRLAYLRGEGIEIALTADLLPSMEDVAKSLGLRRLAPVSGGEPQRYTQTYGDSRSNIELHCVRCGKRGFPIEMLANLDGEPYNSYEHEKCPQQ